MQLLPADLRRLDELGLNSSVPPGQLLYDGWLLRLLPGDAKRARCVNAICPSTRPLHDKLAYCERLYRRHGLPVVFRITPFSEPATLDAELERLGYRKFDLTAVEVAGIESTITAPDDVHALPLPEWVDGVGRLRGSPPAYRASHLERLRGSTLQHRAMALKHGDTVVATGLTMVEDGWAGLFDIVTDPAARRQGYGRRIVQALLAAGLELGASRAYLQVTSHNTSARALYRRFGFIECYRYWYRSPPEGNPP